MKCYNTIDEQGRLVKQPVFYIDGNGQYESHSVSYLYVREQYKELGQIMGLKKHPHKIGGIRMVKITVELDDAELTTLIKEEWYKKARYQTSRILRDKAEEMIYRFINENANAFEEMFAEALKSVLKEYTIRDLKQIEKMLKVKNKDAQTKG
jgi:hypothetical protein